MATNWWRSQMKQGMTPPPLFCHQFFATPTILLRRSFASPTNFLAPFKFKLHPFLEVFSCDLFFEISKTKESKCADSRYRRRRSRRERASQNLKVISFIDSLASFVRRNKEAYRTAGLSSAPRCAADRPESHGVRKAHHDLQHRNGPRKGNLTNGVSLLHCSIGQT